MVLIDCAIAPHTRTARKLSSLEMTKPIIFATVLLFAACASSPKPAVAPAPALRALFNVTVPEPGQPMPTPSPIGTRTRPPCLYSARFSGLVLPEKGDAKILLTRAFVNVERHNDKKFDALTLRLEVAEPAHALGAGNAVQYHLTPTVDSRAIHHDLAAAGHHSLVGAVDWRKGREVAVVLSRLSCRRVRRHDERLLRDSEKRCPAFLTRPSATRARREATPPHGCFRKSGVNAMPSNKPSGLRKRLTVCPHGSFLFFTSMRYPWRSSDAVACSTFSTSNSSHA